MKEGKSPESIEYLKSRDFDGTDIKEFRIGFAEKDEKNTNDFFKKNNLSKTDLKNLGLLSERGNFLFKNRIIFPITNLRNETVGFGGRALDDFGPKYLNTAESSIYRKNRTLYFTSEFLSDLKKKKFVILVEGYFDVIAFNKLGFHNVASPSGTALTVQQINLLSRYTKEIYLCFDNDEAGDSATKRVLEIKNNQPSEVNFFKLNLPKEFKDISELYESGDSDISKIINEKVDLVEFCINKIIDKDDTKKTFQEFKKLSSFLGPLEKDLSIGYLSKKIGITKEVLTNELEYQSDNEPMSQTENSSSQIKHIETFQEILTAELIKKDFNIDDDLDSLINLNFEYKKFIDELKANKNSHEFEKYENISYSDSQLKESIARLYIYFSELKIENLIKEMDESNDLSLLENLEDLKKKIEFYQNTL